MMPVVELRGVKKTYPNGTQALKGVDLVIEAGEVVGLIGPNGAGKTTLVKLLLGLLKPTSGTVRLWDCDSYALPPPLKQKIGFLLEETGLYENLTVEENLTFWTKVYEVDAGRIERRVKEWNLWDKRKELAKKLSAGMKQRLSIARSTLHDPAFLVMDEPTSNLDPTARKSVVDLLKGYIGTDKTLFITSHDLFDIERICTRIVLIRRGMIAAQGSMEELKRQLGVGREVRIKVSKRISETVGKDICERYQARVISGDELIVYDEGADTRTLVRFLVEQGIDVERVEEQKVTLEDLYTTIVKEDEER
ncbi:MAG: ABC transporter ATP-binding protein [Candidatus Bipolaricaulia bacterium]